jgi:hypothetical protein
MPEKKWARLLAYVTGLVNGRRSTSRDEGQTSVHSIRGEHSEPKHAPRISSRVLRFCRLVWISTILA